MALPAAFALVLVGGSVAGAAPHPSGVAGVAPTQTTSSGAHIAALSTPPAHPDDDYMGSTIATHETTQLAPNAQTATPAGTQGLDVSHYQGTIDWKSVAAAGAQFAYMKATEGSTYVDPQFDTNFSGSYAAALVRGAYHFGLPDDSSGATQANYFVDHGGAWVADGDTLPPVLDIEYNPYGDSCYGLTPTQISAWLTDFVNTVHSRTNRWPVIYTTAGWWSSCTGNTPAFAANSPLWLANYGTDPGTLPAGWTSYILWQYANQGTFPGDQDVFNGTLDQLHAFATGDGNDPIMLHYNHIGGATSYLGSPAGGEYTVGRGWARNYQNGVIDYSASSGAWAVHGAILDHYRQWGGPAGTPGFPTTDENGTPDGIGRYNHFTNDASVYWSPNTGAWAVHGAIRDKWASLGWETSALGYPTSDETGTSDGLARYNTFAGTGGSAIYWTPNTAAHSVQGAIYAHWQQVGGETTLGGPTTDETTTPDGIGRYNHFTNDASVYWSPNTGAWAVHGAIRDKWASMGWETSALGYPTSDEFAIAGGRRNNFEHGAIEWYSSDNSTAVFYN